MIRNDYGKQVDIRMVTRTNEIKTYKDGARAV